MTSKHHKWQAKWQTTHHADGCISLTHADGLQMLDVPVGQPIPAGARPVAGLAATPPNMMRTYTPGRHAWGAAARLCKLKPDPDGTIGHGIT